VTSRRPLQRLESLKRVRLLRTAAGGCARRRWVGRVQLTRAATRRNRLYLAHPTPVAALTVSSMSAAPSELETVAPSAIDSLNAATVQQMSDALRQLSESRELRGDARAPQAAPRWRMVSFPPSATFVKVAPTWRLRLAKLCSPQTSSGESAGYCLWHERRERRSVSDAVSSSALRATVRGRWPSPACFGEARWPPVAEPSIRCLRLRCRPHLRSRPELASVCGGPHCQ
jgi:hypothetical protein